MTLSEKQAQLIDDLSLIQSPTERLTAIMDRARREARLPETSRLESHRVQGCVSAVWIIPKYQDGCCYFQTDADSHMVRGLVYLLCDLFSGYPPEAILTTEPEMIRALGLDRQLSPTRLQGLDAVHTAITGFAKHCAQRS